VNSALMFSKASDEWSTPDEVFYLLDLEFMFAVDAAASGENAKCRIWYGPGGLAPDALALKDWRPDVARAIWVNPPYSKCKEFIAKSAYEAREHGCTVVCLVPSRTDTRWWHEHVWDNLNHCTRPDVEVRFLKGRLKFGNSQNGAPFPSVVIVFRPPA
jgi:phage N-6-adenine-methyltransferase